MRLVHACNRYYPACLIVEGILALRPNAVYLDAKRILNSRLNNPLVDARSPPGACFLFGSCARRYFGALIRYFC